MKSCVIILSQRLLGSEYQQRLEKGIDVYKEHSADYIVLPSESGNEKNIQFLQAFGIPRYKILTEPASRDTIGEACFVKRNILVPQNIQKIYVVSSDYHLDYRAKIIFDYILENEYIIEYCCAETQKMRDRSIISGQLQSLQYFNNFVDGRLIVARYFNNVAS